jgi:hypothetical protein
MILPEDEVHCNAPSPENDGDANPLTPGPSNPDTSPPAPGPASLDAIISGAINGIQPGWSPVVLDTHIRQFCETLIEQHASPVVLNACYAQLRDRLKALKLSKLTEKQWKQLLDDAAATYAFNHPESTDTATALPATLILHVLPGAPVPSHAAVPDGWKVLPKGIYKIGKDLDIQVCAMPLVITELLVNDAEETVALKLAWKRNGYWQSHVVARSLVAAKNRIIDLADYGLAITTSNADAVIDYLAALETQNLTILPQTQVRRQMGWIDKGKTGFLWGRQLLRSESVATTHISSTEPCSPEMPQPTASSELNFTDMVEGNEQPAPDTTGANDAASHTVDEQVFFQGADAGDEQIADGFLAEGSFEGWCAAVQPILTYGKPRLVLTASLSTPLLSILGAKNYIVDLCGPSSKGKTITLRTAASAWGRPDEQTQEAALALWNASRVWIERGATVLNNIPLILDDTKLAKKQEDIPQVLYDIASGRGRGRGTTRGTERTGTWSTTLLTSGEAPATSHSQDGGTRARVLTLWGLPLGEANEKTAQVVQHVNEGIQQHFGHASPRFVQYLLDHRDRWPVWKEWYRQIKSHYVAKAKGNSVLIRLSDALAVITLTGVLAGKALGLKHLKSSPVKALWATIASATADADRTEQALRYALEWACSHQDEFFGRREASKSRPNGGWVGRWDGDHAPGSSGSLGAPKDAWSFLGFFPARLRKILVETGYEYEPTVQGWKDRGWLLIDNSDAAKLHHQATLDGEKPRLIAITREATVTVNGAKAVTEEARPPWLAEAVELMCTELELNTMSAADHRFVSQHVEEAILTWRAKQQSVA